MAAVTGDRRRFQGPSTSKPLSCVAGPSKPSSRSARPTPIRPVYIQPGLVHPAPGSCYFESGSHKVIVSVYGPRPTPPSAPFNASLKLVTELKFAPFSSRKRRYAPGKDTESTELAALVSQALSPAIMLHRYPKSQVEINIVVLERDADEQDLAGIITASSAALALAGVEMYGLVIGITAGFLRKRKDTAESIVIDPTEDEADECESVVSIACIPAMGTMTSLRLRRPVQLDQLDPCLDKCWEVAKGVHHVVRESLLEHVQQQSQ